MIRIIILVTTLLLSTPGIYAQAWMLAHQPSSSQPGGRFLDIHPLPNGDYIAGGSVRWTSGSASNYYVPYLARIDNAGNIIWEGVYPYLSEEWPPFNGVYDTGIQRITLSPDGGFFGTYRQSQTSAPAWIAKFDEWGDTLWVRKFNHALQPGDHSEVALPDGGIMIKNVQNQSNPNLWSVRLTRLDSMGIEVFDSVYSNWQDVTGTYTSQIHLSPDSNSVYVCDFSQHDSATVLIKFDLMGNVEWDSLYYPQMPNQYGVHAYGMDIAPDGSIVIGLWGRFSLWPATYRLGFMKLDADGTHQWTNSPNVTFQLSPTWALNFSITENGDFLTLYQTAGGPDQILRFNPSGGLRWSRQLATGDLWSMYSLRESQSNGLVLAGSINFNFTPLAVHLDSLGEHNFNLVMGTVFADTSSDCLYQPDETYLEDWLVLQEPGTYYTLTDQNGDYEMLADSGDHWISVIPPASLWADLWQVNCPSNPDSHFVSFTGVVNPDTAQDKDFAVEPAVYCPLLYVDIAAPFLRRCSTSNYLVSYQNFGTLPADSAYIEVNFDSTLTYVSSTLPATAIPPGNNWRFDIGTVPVGGSGFFQITVDVACDTLNPGRTHCARAHIFPDSACVPPDPNWSGASISVVGECTPQDSVRFTIRNDGLNGMISNSGVWVVEDDILFYQGNINLGAGLDTSWSLPGMGSTWSLIVDQVPLHPGISRPRTVIEGCGTNGQGGISLGFATQFGEDDLNHFISIDCQEDIGSYDPNDKRGIPSGVGNLNRILATDEMEYLIRFQNTGNDTAFRVVIRDEIPEHLDLGTLVHGPSSHPHDFRIVNGRTLEWVFHPILLPDSGVDQEGSNGFVKFTIRQQEGNTIGTRIENAAAIYFDFNAPVVTDTAWHTIGERLETIVILDREEAFPDPKAELLFYPNPFTDKVTFELPDYQPKHLVLEVFNLQGQRIRKLELNKLTRFEFYRDHLPSGMYPFRLSDQGEVLQTGKLIVQEL